MQDIRNIAIIAHVDHGKTTLVDKMLLAGHLFRENQSAGELILDNNDLERERGITILSKNVSINYKGTKINIIDTPGHADFGGEVERVLNMADGCLLLVDAFEGPMPQTRFVLQKAIQMGLKPVVVVNKVDKPNCRPDEVNEMVFDLMFNLDATEEQLEFPTIYGSAKQNWMGDDWKTPANDITALLDAIIRYIPAPTQIEGEVQMLITSLDYSSYVGRIAVGRVHRGAIREGMEVGLCKKDGSVTRQKIKELHTFEGMGRKKVQEVVSGDICAIVGLENFEIGDTVTLYANGELGTVPENDQALREGTIQIGSGTTGGLGDPSLSYFDCPNLVGSNEQAKAMMDRSGELYQYTEQVYAGIGMKMLSIVPGGFPETSSNKAARSYEELSGLKIRTLENPIAISYWQAWGCNPTPVTFSELYIALQQGLVEAQENAYDTIVASKLYEQQKYIINTHHVIMWSGMYMNLDFYNGLPADYQELINWVVAEIYEPFLYEESIKANDAALQVMKDAGLEVIDFTPEDLAKMREAAKPAYGLIRETVGDEPMELIAKARAAAAG